MTYKLNVDVNRGCVEQYSVEVEAGDPEEAMDLVYQFFVDYPNGDNFLKTVLRKKEQTNGVEVLNVEFEREEGTMQDDLRTGVFGEDD